MVGWHQQLRHPAELARQSNGWLGRTGEREEGLQHQHRIQIPAWLRGRVGPLCMEEVVAAARSPHIKLPASVKRPAAVGLEKQPQEPAKALPAGQSHLVVVAPSISMSILAQQHPALAAEAKSS